MKYGILTATNPERDEVLWRKLYNLYVGGFCVQDHAGDYLPQAVGESALRYKERLGCASYINYLGMIIDSFVGQSFGQEIVCTVAVDADNDETMGSELDDPMFWQEFAQNADLRGRSFSDVVQHTFLGALLRGKSYLGIDFPRVGTQASTRTEEDALGAARAYLYEIHPDQLLDWAHSSVTEVPLPGTKIAFKVHQLSWAIVRAQHCDRPSPESSREGAFVEEFKVWRMIDGFAAWETYKTPPRRKEELISPDQDIPLFDQGVTSFREIPIVELEMPHGLWVGNKIGPMTIEHFQRRSALISAENKSLYAIPYAKLGSEMGPTVSLAQENPDRGRDPVAQFAARGFLTMGQDDEIGYAEPTGACYALIEQQLDRLVDEIFRVVFQMAASVSSTSTAAGRSGDSKQEDRRAELVVLRALGQLVRAYAVRIYALISDSRGEDVIWTPHGLDKFDNEDRAQTLDEATQIEAVAIPSSTFKRLWKTKLAFALLGPVPPATQQQIQKEIADNEPEEPESTPTIADDDTEAEDNVNAAAE